MLCYSYDLMLDVRLIGHVTYKRYALHGNCLRKRSLDISQQPTPTTPPTTTKTPPSPPTFTKNNCTSSIYTAYCTGEVHIMYYTYYNIRSGDISQYRIIATKSLIMGLLYTKLRCYDFCCEFVWLFIYIILLYTTIS